MSELILSCRDLVRTFSDGELSVEVLKGITLDVSKGESLSIIGSSGSGKSTLLHCLGGLDKPTSGEVTLAGNNLFSINERIRNQLRNQSLGFVYQFHHLLQELTAVEIGCFSHLCGCQQQLGNHVPVGAAEAFILVHGAGTARKLTVIENRFVNPTQG